MSRNDKDYLDDPEIIDFNEKIDAREAEEMEEDEIPTSPLMFGPSGRGSPEMDLKEPRVLYRDAAKALRRAGMNDDSHLKDPTNLVLNEQQKKEAEEKQIDDMLANMYKEMTTMKPVKSAVRPSSKKKGGTRKRSRTRRSRKSRKSRKSTRRSRRNKNRRR